MIKKEIKITVYEYNTVKELSDEYQDLVQKAMEISQKAYAPYSKFKVGASLLLENRQIITGNNQENAAYPSGLCAERVALFYANSLFPTIPVMAIAITAFYNGQFIETPIPPCGACRQVLIETETRFNKPINVILAGKNNLLVIKSVSDLLPIKFDENFLKT
jgi:cytidine deaminase